MHVPASFSEDEPDIGFTHNHLDCKIDEHPIGKRMPCPSATPRTQPLDDRLRSLLVPPGYPDSFKELVRRRYPQLALLVTTFDDATIVSWLWPHTLADARGMHAMVTNWSRVLSGRSDLVDALAGAQADALQEIEEDPKYVIKEAHVMDDLKMTSMWRKVVFVVLLLWDNFVTWGFEKRTIYVPASALAGWLSRARKEAQDAADTMGLDDAFASEGDVATAWLAQAGSRQAHRRPMMIADVVGFRDRLPFLSNTNTPGVLVQNAVNLVFTPISASDMASSLGRVALLHRQSLKGQLETPQLAESMRRARVALRTGSTPSVFYGSPWARAILSNNVSGSNMITAAEFGAAVVRAGNTSSSATRQNPPGTATFYYGSPTSSKTDMPCFRTIWGKDRDGGLWMGANLSKKEWETVEADLATMQSQ